MIPIFADGLNDPTSRIYWVSLFSSGLIAVLVSWSNASVRTALRSYGWRIWSHPSARADYALWIIKVMLGTAGLTGFLIGSLELARWVAVALLRTWPSPALNWPVTAVAGLYTVVLFLASDWSRYALHRLMHTSWLWHFHQVHHSAEVLTPITLFRTHPVESFLFYVRGVLVSGLLAGLCFFLFGRQADVWSLWGVNVFGQIFNMLGGNLRHSHIPVGFGALESLVLSPRQHQLHHSIHPGHYGSNYGTWLALWDRLGHSWRSSDSVAAPLNFGVPDAERNHNPRQLVSMMVDPVRSSLASLTQAMRSWRRAAPTSILLAFLTASMAQASDVTTTVTAPTDPVAPHATDSTQAEDARTSYAATPSDVTAHAASMPEEMSLLLPELLPSISNHGLSLHVSADRKGLPHIAGSAHSINETELERHKNTDIHKVLAKVPGVYTRGEDGFGLRPNIGMRGANSDRSAKVTLLEDGILLAPAAYAAPAAYYFPMAARLVGVEVFKGPASIRTGPQTVGGAINLLTRPIPEHRSGGADVAYGLYRSARMHLHYGQSWQGWGFLVEGLHMRTGGYKELPDDSDTGFEKNDLMAKFGYQTGGQNSHDIEFKGGFADERSHETYLGLTADDFADRPYQRYAASQLDFMQWRRYQAELRYTFSLPSFVWHTALYRHDFDRSWFKLNGMDGSASLQDLLANPGGQNDVLIAVLRGEEDSVGPGETLRIGDNHRTFMAQGIQNSARWSAQRGEWGHLLELGARLHKDSIARDHTEGGYRMQSGRVLSDGSPLEQTTLGYDSVVAGALYAFEELQWRTLTMTPGMRTEIIERRTHDRQSDARNADLDTVVIPGMGVWWQMSETVGWFAGVHRGFSPVGPREPDQALPETSVNYETGLRYRHKNTRLEAIGYLNDYSNLSGTCTLSAGCTDDLLNRQFNAGRVWIAGAESTARQQWNLRGGWIVQLDGSYTYTWSYFRSSFVSASPQFGTVAEGDALPYVPMHQGSVGLLAGTAVWEIAPTLVATGAMRDIPGQGEIPDQLRIPAYVVLDLASNLRLGDITIYGQGKNITNATYATSYRPYGLRPGQPMYAELGVRYSLQ